jgi:hypothetical protein
MQTSSEITVYRIANLGMVENGTENLGIFVDYAANK